MTVPQEQFKQRSLLFKPLGQKEASLSHPFHHWTTGAVQTKIPPFHTPCLRTKKASFSHPFYHYSKGAVQTKIIPFHIPCPGTKRSLLVPPILHRIKKTVQTKIPPFHTPSLGTKRSLLVTPTLSLYHKINSKKHPSFSHPLPRDQMKPPCHTRSSPYQKKQYKQRSLLFTPLGPKEASLSHLIHHWTTGAV